MTRRTLSPYVGITTSTDGPLPTDPLYVDTFEELATSRGASSPVSDRKYVIWVLLGRVRHLFGLHTWVPLEEWDLDVGSMRYIGRLCWHCQARDG